MFFFVAFGGEGDEAVDQLFVGDAGGLPELGVHADAGEAGHGVDFVEVDAGGSGFLFFFALVAGSMRKSTRARPAQSQARKAAMAILRTCLDSALESLAGMMGTLASEWYLAL